ncbi:hypothetical protein [Sabulibacter ruber]|uniref:hypothetical protein n=1 Tax=Sabulibacter ruber TaxID=2811901 RepID=UPI001A9640AE|nr:hypothetical protein [Sabulibacter ruber]
MKKLTLSFRLLTLLLCSFLAVSCGDDDDEEQIAPLSNQIEYNNTRYNADLALSWDFGPIGFSEDVETHYAQEFALLDTVTKTLSVKAALDMFLLSSGTTTFKTGTFDYVNLDDEIDFEDEESVAAATAKYRDKNLILQTAFLLDSNNDEEFDEDTEVFEVTGGSITVSGTAPNYTIECDVQLQNNNGLKAHYSGEVLAQPVDPDEEEEDTTANMRKAPKATSFKRDIPALLKAR